jgi:preprotein translocase subunit SecD
MAYIGQRPQVGNFVKIDDISSQFNSSTQTFNVLVSGVPYSPSNPYAAIVALGGAIQNPGVDFNFNGSTISFTTAPTAANNGKFFCIVLGDVLTVGVPSNNSVTNSMLVPGTVQYSALATTTKATLLANSLLFGA